MASGLTNDLELSIYGFIFLLIAEKLLTRNALNKRRIARAAFRISAR